MKNVQGTKLFIAMMVTTAFIFSFSHFGAKAFEELFVDKESYIDGTSIAGVNISGMSYEEALQAIKMSQEEWQKSSSIHLKYKEKAVDLDLGIFTFQYQDSLNSIIPGTDNVLTVSANQEELEAVLNSISSYLVKEDTFYLNKWSDSLLAIASHLDKGSHEINLQDYLVSNQEEVILTDTTIDVSKNQKNIAKWVKNYPTVDIAKEENFSFLNMLGESSKDYSDTTLSMVATALHKVILATNFTIAERFTSNQLPEYAPLGYEVKINQTKKMDYRFVNPNESSYKLQFKMVDDKLYISLTGIPFMYKYEVVLSDKETFKQKTVIQFDSLLEVNEYKTISEGSEGILIKVYRKLQNDNGETIKKELISEDFYPPINKVVASGLMEKEEITLDKDSITDSNELSKEDNTENQGETNQEVTDESKEELTEQDSVSDSVDSTKDKEDETLETDMQK